MASTIIAPTPLLKDQTDQTEVRKALSSIVRDANTQINVVGQAAAAAAVAAGTPEWLPYPAGPYVFPSGTIVATSGQLVIGASTTAPTFNSSAIMTAYYRDHGTTIDIMFTIQQTATAGTAIGSGCYYLPMPLGFSIDSTKITFATNDVSNLGRFNGTVIGFGKLGATPYFGSLWLTANNAAYMQSMVTYVNIGAGGSNGGQWGTTGNATFTPNVYAQLNMSWECFGIPVV